MSKRKKMAHYDQQEAARPGGFFIAIVVIVALGIPILIIASLAFGLQPTLPSKGSGTTGTGGAVVIIPQGVGSDQSLNYQPATITVIVGVNNTVIWQQNDPIPHTVTSVQVPGGVESFDSGNLNKGQPYQFTFNVPGTYLYHCTYHPGWMKGTIIVKAH